MARQAKSNYIEAGLQVLTELGGGPIRSKDLVRAAEERGLIGTTPYVYHNFLRKLRESDMFDTSTRGHVSLAPGSGPVAEEIPGTDPIIVEGAPAAVISEILSGVLPDSDALDNVEDEEIDPDGFQSNEEK